MQTLCNCNENPDGQTVPLQADASMQAIIGGLDVRLEMPNCDRTEPTDTVTGQLLQALFHSSPAAIIVVNPDGAVTMWNQAAERIYGWKSDEVLGSLLPLNSPEGVNEFWALRGLVMGGKPVCELELVRSRKDGTPVHVAFSAIPLYDAEGEISAIMTTSTDITRCKLGEAALRQWQDIFKYSRMGMVVGNPDGTIRMANPAYAEMTGYGVEELGGRPIVDLFAPDSRHLVQTYLQAVHETGHYVLDSWHIRRDGTVFQVMVDGTAVKDETGNVLYRVASIQDISARKEAEEVLRRNEDHYRTIIENSMDITCVLDVAGIMTYVSPSVEETLGYRPQELVGNSAFEFIHPADTERARKLFSKVLNHSLGMAKLSYRFMHKDGSWRILEAAGRRLPHEENGDKAVINCRDITERKEAESEIHRLNAELEQRVRERTAQLEAANRELESFCYSVSHDLRAPLRHINGFSGALFEDYGHCLDENGLRYIDRLRAATSKMEQLIEGLLNLSGITRGTLRRQYIDLSGMLQDMATELTKNEPTRQCEFRIAPEMTAYGDVRLIRSALENLLGNAWKYTSKKAFAVIECGVIAGDGVPAFFVRDNGAGFNMAYADKLFGAFQRLHSNAEFEGTGIGLATVQRIINRHGGEVWAEAEVGVGATFYFTLPSNG